MMLYNKILCLLVILFTIFFSNIARAGIFPPNRIGGTVTVDGIRITQDTDDGYVFTVTRPDGAPYLNCVGNPAEDTDGLNSYNCYILDIPHYDPEDVPQGAKEGDLTIIHVYKDGAELTITSPSNGRHINSGDANVIGLTVESTVVQYGLAVDTAGQGAVTPSGGSYASGTLVQLTANPDPGWQFSQWSGDISGTANPVEITMNSNKAISATFVESAGNSNPAGGYSNENIIPSNQVNQSTNGNGIITVHFKIKDQDNDPCNIHSFQYSINGGSNWNVPVNGDNSLSLSNGWKDNNTSSYSSATDYNSAEAHSFTFNTRHQDVTGLDGNELSEIRVRFKVNDGTNDSLAYVVTDNFSVDNRGPDVEITYDEPNPYKDSDSIIVTANFTDFSPISGIPKISIDYEGEDVDVSAANMSEVNKEWTYLIDIPQGHDGNAVITVTGNDEVGNPVGACSGNTFIVDNTHPYFEGYPTINYTDKSIIVTFSENNMRNTVIENNYSFSPSLNFATGGNDIAELGENAYRLSMASIPYHIIITLTVNEVTDQAGNTLTPKIVRLNDNDNDAMADDWEADNSVDAPEGDPDNDALTNLDEYLNNTDPNNSDTDGDGMSDGWEVNYGLDPTDNTGDNGADADFDHDGWTNAEEYENETDPADDNSHPAASPPEIVENIPYYGAGIGNDITRIPNNSSFYVRVEDSQGINIEDTGSIVFIINDGVNELYTRDLSNDTVTRVIKLTEDDNTEVTKLWAVYDRSKEDNLGNYDYDAQVNIKVNIKNRRNAQIGTAPDYDFRIESEAEHNKAHAPGKLPETGDIEIDDPDLEDSEYSYDTGIQVIDGDLEGAKIIYNSSEPVLPSFGPINEIPGADDDPGQPVLGNKNNPSDSIILNFQPPTVYNTPVKVIIPCPGHADVNGLYVFLYKGANWIPGCDNKGNVMTGGDGWMVPGSRVNHNNGDPSTIEIKVYHQAPVRAGSIWD